MKRISKRSGALPVAEVLVAAFLGLGTLSAAAAPIWLVAAPDESLRSDEPIMLDVVRPSAQDEWPESLALRLEQDNKTWEAPLSAVGPVGRNDARRTYRAAMPARLSGLIRGELDGVESNRLALMVREPDAIEQMMSPEDDDEAGEMQNGRTLSLVVPEDEAALSANEPMYFVVGQDGVARFQFSFKYRMFDPDSQPVAWFSPLANLHFGYTQTSMWDLGEESKPFRDTSYRPSFFWQGATLGDGMKPDMMRAGFEHESNGKEGSNSRSINTFFLQSIWLTRFSDGRILGLMPKVYAYQDKTDNPDIQRYRGYADWEFGYGRPDGAVVMAHLRSGTAGYGSALVEISYPLRKRLFARAGGFVFLQISSGYGETLLDYNRRSSTQARLGFAIVR